MSVRKSLPYQGIARRAAFFAPDSITYSEYDRTIDVSAVLSEKINFIYSPYVPKGIRKNELLDLAPLQEFFKGEIASITWDTNYLQFPIGKTKQMVEIPIDEEEPIKLKTSLNLLNPEIDVVSFKIDWDMCER